MALVDLESACQRSFAHGPLLALRYVVAGLHWQRQLMPESMPQARAWMQRLLALVKAAGQLAVPPLATPQDLQAGRMTVRSMHTWQDHFSFKSGSCQGTAADHFVLNEGLPLLIKVTWHGFAWLPISQWLQDFFLSPTHIDMLYNVGVTMECACRAQV